MLTTLETHWAVETQTLCLTFSPNAVSTALIVSREEQARINVSAFGLQLPPPVGAPVRSGHRHIRAPNFFAMNAGVVCTDNKKPSLPGVFFRTTGGPGALHRDLLDCNRGHGRSDCSGDEQGSGRQEELVHAVVGAVLCKCFQIPDLAERHTHVSDGEHVE